MSYNILILKLCPKSFNWRNDHSLFFSNSRRQSPFSRPRREEYPWCEVLSSNLEKQRRDVRTFVIIHGVSRAPPIMIRRLKQWKIQLEILKNSYFPTTRGCDKRDIPTDHVLPRRTILLRYYSRKFVVYFVMWIRQYP